MVHKFIARGEYVYALHAMTRRFYESSICQKCSWITLIVPPPLRRRISYMSNELVDYRDEILNIIEVQIAFVVQRPAKLGFFQAVLISQLMFIVNMDDPLCVREFENAAPRLASWVQLIIGTRLSTSKSIRKIIGDYKISRSIFERTPTEAARLYKAGFRHTPFYAPGSVPVYFYSSFEKGKYGPVEQSPDLIVWPYANESKGISLYDIREKLGIESVAIITEGKGPFRTTFEPADEDWLSPLAVWVLTTGHKQPLRVFEHRVSNVTKTKRAIREPVYLAVVFIATVLQLTVGYPEKNVAYMTALYGSRYARMYSNVGRVTSTLNNAVVRGTQLLFQGVVGLCIVPCIVLYMAVSFIFRIIQSTASAVLNALLSAVRSLRVVLSMGATATASTVSSLDTKGWLILSGLLWFGLAELYSLS